MLSSLANSACMNKLCYQESLDFWLKNDNVIDCALGTTDCLKHTFVYKLLASAL